MVSSVVMLCINEHSSANYPPRTYFNAKCADITIAFAVDFATAGEKLTKRAAGEKYFAVSLFDSPIESARAVYGELRNRKAKTVNVAGNGIYTVEKHGFTQEILNLHLFEIFSKVHEHWPIERMVSGGQTGVDIAGVTVAVALGIEAVATLPKGFLQRNKANQDISRSEYEIALEVKSAAEKLNMYYTDKLEAV